MTTDLVPVRGKERALPSRIQKDPVLVPGGPVPGLVVGGGRPTVIAWDNFFQSIIANDYTRRDYEGHVRRFFAWLERNGCTDLRTVTAGVVGRYIRSLAPKGKSLSRKKQCRTALKKFFDELVEKHICLVNPVAAVRTEKLVVTEGMTPQISYEEVWALHESIDRTTLVGKRDLAVLAMLNFTGRRAGAVASRDLSDLQQEGGHWSVKFVDKGGKVMAIPLPEDLEKYLFDWLNSSEILQEQRRRDELTGEWIPQPMFRTFVRRTGKLSQYQHERRDPHTRQLIQKEKGRMSGKDINYMMKRRLRAAALPQNCVPHSYRVAAANDLADQGVTLEEIQTFLGHTDPRTTQVYMRGERGVSRNLVERIRVGRVLTAASA